MTQDIKNDDVVFGSLKDYFDPEKFRIVRDDGIFIDGGISEIKVVINLTDSFAKSLSYYKDALSVVFGYAIMSEKLREVNQARYPKDGILKKVTMNDWGDKFAMILELDRGENPVVYIKPAEVKTLLEECRRVLGN